MPDGIKHDRQKVLNGNGITSTTGVTGPTNKMCPTWHNLVCNVFVTLLKEVPENGKAIPPFQNLDSTSVKVSTFHPVK